MEGGDAVEVREKLSKIRSKSGYSEKFVGKIASFVGIIENSKISSEQVKVPLENWRN